ncbi:MAG: hypothetical protein JW757_10065 [Anaerolineales bacterium]|nr:hypothetical protein [Anaerolineales bacterium]
MHAKSILQYLWKLPVSAIAFFIGMALSGALLPMLGLQSPEMPAGTDANTIALWFMLGSLILALPLSFLSRNLAVKPPGRWLILFALTWGIGGVGMVLESYFFMETGAVSSVNSALFTILNFVLPSLCLTGAVVWFFPPAESTNQSEMGLDLSGWGWKLAAALSAYPAVYFIFGLLVQPFVIEFYSQGQYELTAPTWGQLIPLQLGRSALFLLICWPVIRFWHGSRRNLWLSLGASFFVLTAFMAVITAYWFPWQLRFFHGLELLADGIIYAGILVILFPGQRLTTQ